MQFDELYKFIGYGFVCLLLLYIIAKSIRFQLGIIEGLAGIKKDSMDQKLSAAEGEEDEVDEGDEYEYEE